MPRQTPDWGAALQHQRSSACQDFGAVVLWNGCLSAEVCARVQAPKHCAMLALRGEDSPQGSATDLLRGAGGRQRPQHLHLPRRRRRQRGVGAGLGGAGGGARRARACNMRVGDVKAAECGGDLQADAICRCASACAVLLTTCHWVHGPYVEVHRMSDWLTYSRAANLEELCDRDALHVAGGVRQLEGHKCFTSATAVLRLSAGMRCRDAEACGWQRRPCLLFQRRGKQRCRGLESRLCVSLCTHRSKGDGGVARLVGDLSIGAANGSAAVKLKGGLPWAAAVCRRVEGQPRAVLNEARQLGWPSCKGQQRGSASSDVQNARQPASASGTPPTAAVQDVRCVATRPGVPMP